MHENVGGGALPEHWVHCRVRASRRIATSATPLVYYQVACWHLMLVEWMKRHHQEMREGVHGTWCTSHAARRLLTVLVDRRPSAQCAGMPDGSALPTRACIRGLITSCCAVPVMLADADQLGCLEGCFFRIWTSRLVTTRLQHFQCLDGCL